MYVIKYTVLLCVVLGTLGSVMSKSGPESRERRTRGQQRLNYRTLGTKGKAAALKEEQEELELEIQKLANMSDEDDVHPVLQMKDKEGEVEDKDKSPSSAAGPSGNTEDLVVEEVEKGKKDLEAEKLKKNEELKKLQERLRKVSGELEKNESCRTKTRSTKVVKSSKKSNSRSKPKRRHRTPTPSPDTSSSSETSDSEVPATPGRDFSEESEGEESARTSGKGKFIDINVLRNMGGLTRAAEKKLAELGLVSKENTSRQKMKKLCRKESLTRHISLEDLSKCSCTAGKGAKSGITSKATDRVINPQIWPHTALQYDWCGQDVQFDQLNFAKLVGGELEIISSDQIGRTEKRGRIRLLKKCAYYANDFDMNTVRAIYSSIMRRIELGLIGWDSDFGESEQLALTKQLCKERTKKFKKEGEGSQSQVTQQGTWFCHNYNRDKCSYRGDHSGMVRGKNRHLKHICAACYLKVKAELRHPESSTACPLRE